MIEIIEKMPTSSQNDKSIRLRIAPFMIPSEKKNIYFLTFISFILN
jgi:hypothetical protein